MNRKRITALLALAALTAAVFAASAAWGSAGAAAVPAGELTLESMLAYAIQDEYLARAEYIAIQQRYGIQRPFSNIQRSEENHIAWLVDAYNTHGLPVPKDEAGRYVRIPASLKDAFLTGVDAEVANIAMYDRFLATPLLARPENAALRDLFTRLRDASQNHLQAFRTGLSRY